jgi:uncharacterized protein YlxP (DUF503 family)
MINDITEHLGILTVSIHIPHAQSLKEKRMVLKSLKDRIRSQFNVSIAELGDQDKWQTAILGVAMIGNDNRYIDSTLQNILSFMEAIDTFNICEHDIAFC